MVTKKPVKKNAGPVRKQPAPARRKYQVKLSYEFLYTVYAKDRAEAIDIAVDKLAYEEMEFLDRPEVVFARPFQRGDVDFS